MEDISKKKKKIHQQASLNWLIQKKPHTKDLLLKYLTFYWKILFHLNALLSAVIQFLHLISVTA